MIRSFIRFKSSAAAAPAVCTTKFLPLVENYKTLRHIHFPGTTPFSIGQAIQKDIVDANIHFKKLESKIIKQQREVAQSGHRLSDYEDTFLQKILAMKPVPTLLTFEFENCYTGGKKLKQDPDLPRKIEEFAELGCKYYQLERGGQTTWHGQGQLVAYLVLDLKKFSQLTVRCFVDSVLLKAAQETLAVKYGLKDSFVNENPGVWMAPNDLKIASVGCNIQRGISSYGISLNVQPDLKFLNTYVMCGLPGTRATSVQERLGDVVGVEVGAEDLTVKSAADAYAKQVAKRLNITTLEHMSGEDLIAELGARADQPPAGTA